MQENENEVAPARENKKEEKDPHLQALYDAWGRGNPRLLHMSYARLHDLNFSPKGATHIGRDQKTGKVVGHVVGGKWIPAAKVRSRIR